MKRGKIEVGLDLDRSITTRYNTQPTLPQVSINNSVWLLDNARARSPKDRVQPAALHTDRGTLV